MTTLHRAKAKAKARANQRRACTAPPQSACHAATTARSARRARRRSHAACPRAKAALLCVCLAAAARQRP